MLVDKFRSKLEEEDDALILLASLPSSYEHLVTSLLHENDSIDLEEIIVALLSNKIRKMDFVNKVQAKAKDLVTCGKTKGKGFDRSHQDFKCQYFH